VLNDYLIYPPTRKELSALIHPAMASPAAVPGSARPAPPQAEQPSVIVAAAALATTDYSRLVTATFSRADLEKCISQIVTSRINQPVQWIDGPSAPAGATVLLKATDATPRLLVVEGVYSPAGPAGAFLLALEEVLPSLWSTARRTEALHHLAITDELTGAYNRRYFYHVTDQIIRRSGQQGRPVTLLLYDIDDFKTYNDRYGYAVGDEILRQTSVMMRQITRGHDIVARIGGDEFAVLFWDKEAREPNSRPPETAYVLANRFLSAVQSHQFPSLGAKGKGVVTISGGLATYPVDGNSCHKLLRKANSALREVKRSGKKAIRIVGPVNSGY
jgi:diguanylate cyclase (GGDEF)-like protein